MINLAAYDPLAAMAVFKALDPHDLREAQLARGDTAGHLSIFADWHGQARFSVVNLVLRTTQGTPFAVLALGNTGQAGVAQAALLARSHRLYRRPMVTAAREIARRMPVTCCELGIHRVEARSWAEHPTAGRFLTACGFAFETDMPGFGADGTATFRQFAWIDPTLKGD